ncbi:hypothetical protein HMPREF1624_07762 [Sporothrix schenckii ATCC 58251]|uniref:Transcription factor domain-containing protein n=1 Tax=Sporothrix schenckii (strain ATCC 58251 / de Perez 2211183) TaxID=1391915 RepID=U7PJG7_SPOS1|nr:hypothetical protein HMPREF1624_07762 [Sporothrix schenckii ATCC 58251]
MVNTRPTLVSHSESHNGQQRSTASTASVPHMPSGQDQACLHALQSVKEAMYWHWAGVGLQDDHHSYKRAANNIYEHIWAAAQLDTVAEHERHIGFFWTAYLPNGEPFPDEASRYTTCGWTRIVREMCESQVTTTETDSTTDLVRLAVVANGLCMLGSQHRDTRMVDDGHQVYGRALQKMRAALQRFESTETKKLALLLTSRLLTMFTLLFGRDVTDRGPPSAAQGEAWVGLNAGEMALLLSSRPEAYQTGDAHQVFVDTRLHLFLPYLMFKSRTSLSRPDWMTVPWAVIPKTPLDRLIDHIGHIPALAEDLTAINSNETLSEKDKRIAKHGLRPRYSAFVAEMKDWFDDVVPGFGIEELLAIGKTKKRKRASEGSSSVLELAKAHTLVLFWATCLLFRGGLLQVLNEDGDIPPEFVNMRAIRYNMLKIMSSVFFSPNSKLTASWYSINIALFPLRIVMGTVGRNDSDDGDNGHGDIDTCPLSPAEIELMAGISKECKARGVASFLNSMGQYLSEGDAKE